MNKNTYEPMRLGRGEMNINDSGAARKNTGVSYA